MDDSFRFWSKVDRRGPDECWPWLGGKEKAAYGRIWWMGRTTRPHRVAFALSGGTITAEKPCVLHSCDNPPCCNPNHLRAGTPAENTGDAILRKRLTHGDDHHARKYPERLLRGESNNKAKLTDEGVRDIRRLAADGLTYSALGRKYGISNQAARNVAIRKTWTHVQ